MYHATQLDVLYCQSHVTTYIVPFTESSLEVQCEPAVVITARLYCTVLCYFNHCLSCKVVCINMELGMEWNVECKGTCNGMWN